MASATELKDLGNKAFSAKDYPAAIDYFSQAINLDASNHVLWSNRSAAKAGSKDYTGALEDAEQCIKVNPTWSKGYARKGAALHGAHRWEDAIAAYEEGLKIEKDSPALIKGLREVKDAQDADSASDPGGFGKMFSDPNLLAKLATNPKTAPLLSDPSFVAKLKAMQTNPALASSAMQDPRMIQVLGALLGIDMQAFERPEGSDELPSGFERAPPPSAGNTSAPGASAPKASPAPATGSAEKADVKMAEPEEVEEEDEDAKAKKEAEELKKKGGDLYKKREFGPASEAFEKAWELWPKDITFLTNLAAVHFESGDYDKCIEVCEKAVDEGRSLRADYKLIAKAFGRIGTAYGKKDDLENAIKFYNKSLSEHRTPDILNKLRDIEKLKKEKDRLAFINPELANEARERGNKLFKEGDFAGAVKAYTEAVNRDPSDPRSYNNRANAYTKLVALPEALKDAEEAIKVDSKFIKGYIRKSLVLFAMREYTKAMEAAQAGMDADTDNKHTAELEGQMTKCAQALYTEREGETEEQVLQRAMRDPEVANIMNDPVMQNILQQAQQNPASLQDHMKSPIVRQKIQKLVAAGIIKTR